MITLFRAAVTMFMIFLVPLISFAQDEVVSGTIFIKPSIENLSIYYEIEQDDNRNSEVFINYRLADTQDSFQPAAMTMRTFPGMVIDGVITDRNYYAGSMMFLEPNTIYEIEIVLSDPEGGGVTRTTIAKTRAVLQPGDNATVRYVAPGNGGGAGTVSSPFLGLQEAADNASAGDLFIVKSGSYEPFVLMQSGTPEEPISFISEVLHGAVIDGRGSDRGIVTLGDFSSELFWVIIDGFRIENGRWGIDAQNTRFITVRNNLITKVDYGYVNRRESGMEQGQHITNNVIRGNTDWPQSGIPNERGVDIRGSGNVVSYNTISNFGDGVSTDGPPYEQSFSLDIHNNKIFNIVDDMIEVDGTIANTRIYNNTCYNGRAGISLAPVYGGPVYVYRNIIANMEISAFKMNRGPAGIILVHNTTINDGNAIESPDGWQNTFSRNNVIIASRYCFELYGLVAGSQDDWDYGAYYTARAGSSGSEWFKWNNVRYGGVSDLQNSGLLEANAIEVALEDFNNLTLPETFPVEHEYTVSDFMPTMTSPVIDSGAELGYINSAAVKDGKPDRGALEYGQDLPLCGAQFDGGTYTFEEEEKEELLVYPNPFTDELILDGDVQPCKLSIIASTGQLISEHNNLTLPAKLSLGNLERGIYYVKVVKLNRGEKTIHMIIKE